MTKKLLQLTKAALLICSISLLFNSCTEEKTYYVDPQGDFAYVLLKDQIKIDANQWVWDDNTARYKASVSFPELQKNDYEFGMAIGNIYITEDANGVDTEKLYPVPYIRSYFNNDVPFTETISCALSYDKKSVEFYIEPSNKIEAPEARLTYYFKVAIVYNFTYSK